MNGEGGDVIGGAVTGADLLISGVLFAGVLLLCAVLAVAVRAGWRRWGPPPPVDPVPTPEEQLRLAVYCLEAAGVDLPAVLGDWSPTRVRKPELTQDSGVVHTASLSA